MTTTNSKGAVSKKPVWLITGCSSGFGHELAKLVLECGYRTVATARKREELSALEGCGDGLLLPLDVTDPDQVVAVVAAAEERFGAIDVLVNNAAIGYFAAVEESDEEQVWRLFEVNVFGLGRMVGAVLPGMRQRRSGVIVNISSLGGIHGMAGVGYYNATKFAVEGLSEALLQEVEPLGIKVMVVEPSGFRSDWAGRAVNEGAQQIDDYAATAGVKRAQLRAVSGRQQGDPLRAAHALVKAVQSAAPPRHLLLGNAAYDLAMSKLDEQRKEFLAGEAVARAADFSGQLGAQAIDR